MGAIVCVCEAEMRKKMLEWNDEMSCFNRTKVR